MGVVYSEMVPFRTEGRNMDNSDYNVDSFVSDMSIGRTLLYQKINDITGMSIKEFIMDVRLKRSAQLSGSRT